MSNETSNAKSPEQRNAEREALLATLGEKVAALSSSEEWLAYLRFIAAFRRFSFSNQMLIAAQCPHATYVAGYRKWQELGRQVCTGEKAIKILGYSTKKITRTDPDNGEEVEDWLVRYPVVSVFDASQTEGAAPISADPYRLPTGDGPDGALDQLTGWLESDGWTLRGLLLAGTCQGYTDSQRRLIATDTRLDPGPPGRAAARSRPRGTSRRPRGGRVPGAPRHLRDPKPNPPPTCWPTC